MRENTKIFFKNSFVKLLSNPTGVSVFCAMLKAKSRTQKSSTQKNADCCDFFLAKLCNLKRMRFSSISQKSTKDRRFRLI